MNRVPLKVLVDEHKHVCWMYDNDEVHEEIMVEFIVEGIKLHHKVVCVVAGAETMARVRV